MLARAVGSQIETEMSSMLDQMFSAGLTVELTSALQVLAEKIPNLQRDIQGLCVCVCVCVCVSVCVCVCECVCVCVCVLCVMGCSLVQMVY